MTENGDEGGPPRASGGPRTDGTAGSLAERMVALERTVRDLAERLDDVEDTRARRRPLLKGLGAAGLLTLGAGRAAADPQGRVGTPESPARVVHTERLGGGVVGDTVVADLLGTGLTTESVDGATALSAAPAANDHVDVTDEFGTTVEDVDRFELAGALSLEDQGDGVVTLDATDDVLPPAWEDADGDSLLEPRASGIDGISGIDRITTLDRLTLSANPQTGTSSVLSLSSKEFTGVARISAAAGESGTSGIEFRDGDIELSGGRIVVGTGSDDVALSAPDTTTVSTEGLSANQVQFALDESNNGVYVYASDGTTSGSAEIATYSTERLKTNVQPFTGDPTDVLDIEARTFEAGNGDGEERLGVTAESAHDAGLSHLVEYAPVPDAWQTEDGIDEAYLDEYGVERDGETLVPNDIRERAWLAMHHELLREVVAERDPPADGAEGDGGSVPEPDSIENGAADRPDRIADLEAAVERRDERIARLEAENERLRERLAAIEQRLGIEGTNTERAADD